MDYLKEIKGKKEERGELETRWQNDEDLLYLKKYVMMDSQTSPKPIPDIVNVTLNRPAVFAANIISALGSTSEQRVVETEDKALDTTYIEDFQKAGFDTANDRLRRYGKPLLNPFADTQFCIRGRTARRVLFRMENDILIPDITPWDGRFVTYEIGGNGLDWGAYETTRSKKAIEAEYGGRKVDGKEITIPSISGKTASVIDVWDTEGNYVYIDKKLVFEQPLPDHIKGHCPIIVQVVSLGYGAILLSEGSLKYEGESIFFLFRDVIPELSRLASIVQTLNLKAVKPPMKVKLKGKGEAPEYEDITGMGTDTRIEPEEDIAPIDYGDAKRAATIAYNMMDIAASEGSVSSADLGMLESPPASGVRAIMAGEHINSLLAPRLLAKALLNEQTAEMFTEQVVQLGGSVELGVKGHKRTFETGKLKGEYGTTYKYTFKSPSVDAGLYSLAAAAGNLIPDKAKREEILQREDPDGDMKQLRWEEAERLSPAIRIYRTIKSLKEQGEDFEAELLASELGVNVDQMMAGEVGQQPKPEKEDEPTQVLSLFGGGAGRAGKPIEGEE